MAKFDEEVKKQSGCSFAVMVALLKKSSKITDLEKVRQGALLSTIKHKRLYISSGYSSFKEFIVNSGIMSVTTAANRVLVWDMLDFYGWPCSYVETLGWSNAYALRYTLTKKNINKWLGYASTPAKMAAEIEKEFAKTKAGKHLLVVELDSDDDRVFAENAIKGAQVKFKCSRGQAVMHMCKIYKNSDRSAA